MTFSELQALVHAHFPRAMIEVNDIGEIVVSTGKTVEEHEIFSLGANPDAQLIDWSDDIFPPEENQDE